MFPNVSKSPQNCDSEIIASRIWMPQPSGEATGSELLESQCDWWMWMKHNLVIYNILWYNNINNIYIMICIFDDSTWHANRLTICSANVTVPENRAKMFFQHLWYLHDSCLGTLRVMSERHSYTRVFPKLSLFKKSLWDSSACQQYAWIPNKACAWYHLVNCLPAEFDIFPKRL